MYLWDITLESAADTLGLQFDAAAFDEPRLKGAVPQVFLSYSWADKDAVEAVDQWLRDKGARVILDERNFVAGEATRDEILRWIQRAGVIVCFVSRHSKDRSYPRLEREIAETLRGKGAARVIYFNLDETMMDLIHEGRLYISGNLLSFDDACEALWSGLVKSARAPKDIDLTQVRNAGISWVSATRNTTGGLTVKEMRIPSAVDERRTASAEGASIAQDKQT